MRIYICQHVPFEGAAGIGDYLSERGKKFNVVHVYRGQPLPQAEDLDLLVMMGGPMSVNDETEHAWLAPEKALTRECVRQGKRILGVCLGAQLIASAQGARVYPNHEREIGWFPVRRTPGAVQHSLGAAMPEEYPAFHWHGETFDLPEGAVWLAQSEACRHQAFALGGRVLGLQFHLETTPEVAEDWTRDGMFNEPAGPYVQTPAQIRAAPEKFAALNLVLAAVLDRLLVD